MPKFEVYIPATEPGGFNLALKVGADNWMTALKAGMQKLGEQGAISQNVMVDIQEDNSIHVTEPSSGRVFRIRELTEEEAARAQVKRPSQIRAMPPELAPVPAAAEAKTEPGLRQSPAASPPAAFDPNKTIPMRAVAADLPKAKGKEPAAPVASPDLDKTVTASPAPANRASPPAPVEPELDKTLPGTRPPEPRAKSGRSAPITQRSRVAVSDVEELVSPVKPVTGTIGRPKTNTDLSRTLRQQAEEILAEAFLRVVEVDTLRTPEEAANFVLDLALEKIPCEAGSVLRADGATGDLTFLFARGPKAKELMGSNIVIPAATGIAGFCSAEGVSLAVSDVEKDPRFYAAVGARVGFETKSMLCAPMMTHGRSFGCVQLINRKGGPQFQEHEVGLLAYLAHQAALFLNARLE